MKTLDMNEVVTCAEVATDAFSVHWGVIVGFIAGAYVLAGIIHAVKYIKRTFFSKD